MGIHLGVPTYPHPEYTLYPPSQLGQEKLAVIKFLWYLEPIDGSIWETEGINEETSPDSCSGPYFGMRVCSTAFGRNPILGAPCFLLDTATVVSAGGHSTAATPSGTALSSTNDLCETAAAVSRSHPCLHAHTKAITLLLRRIGFFRVKL
jgi:hypothetical protein